VHLVQFDKGLTEIAQGVAFPVPVAYVTSDGELLAVVLNGLQRLAKLEM
jgi:hypothetical protein